MAADLRQEVDKLLKEFAALVRNISQERRLRTAVVRSLLPCSLLLFLDRSNLFAVGQRHWGMPSYAYIHDPEKELTPYQAIEAARWEIGFEDPFLIAFPGALIKQAENQRRPQLHAIALAHVDSEFQRVIKMTSLIQLNPLFGSPSYSVDERLAFVLMPFADDLTRIYSSIIKPAIETTGLVCRRADDFKSNKAIIQDIWKAICEARVVVADLTDLNPNVMYELGIAHTVGKETILIYQHGRGRDPQFPFDLAHIRRIEYEDTATGGKKLEDDLVATLNSILRPAAVS